MLSVLTDLSWQKKGKDVVKLIKDVSVNRRSCKQSPVLYALAICARSNDVKTKDAAYRVLSNVCRIPTHLFEFVKYCERESAGTGWGRAHKTGIQKWYTNYDPEKLAHHVTKYQSRHSWSHRDVLRLSHVKPENNATGIVLKYIIKGLEEVKSVEVPMGNTEQVDNVLKYLEAVDLAKKCTNVEKLKELIASYELKREHVPTGMLESPEIWKSLLLTMPMNAMIRNLGKMSKLGLLASKSFGEEYVLKKLELLGNNESNCRTRLHPFNLLTAWYQYKCGKGDKGKLEWPVNQNIVTALTKAFYDSFREVETTGKRYMLAVDVSSSMMDPVQGSSAISCRDAAAAMMLLTTKTEKHYEVMAFSETPMEIIVTTEDDIQSVKDKCSKLKPGPTDCAWPMKYACEKKKPIDVFIVYTDSKTFFGNMHPSRALEEYRKYIKIHDARLIVVGMASNGFTIADPCDKFMLDIVGFDTEAPKAMHSFITGEFDRPVL